MKIKEALGLFIVDSLNIIRNNNYPCLQKVLNICGSATIIFACSAVLFPMDIYDNMINKKFDKIRNKFFTGDIVKVTWKSNCDVGLYEFDNIFGNAMIILKTRPKETLVSYTFVRGVNVRELCRSKIELATKKEAFLYSVYGSDALL